MITKNSQTRKGRKPINKFSERLRPKMERALDKWFGKWIVKRDGGVCFVTGKRAADGYVIQCGHLITRAARATRWNETNCHAQERGSNFLHEHRPEFYTQAFIAKYGAEAYDELVALSKKPHKMPLDEMAALTDYYRRKVEESA